jgi:hypothetical protein
MTWAAVFQLKFPVLILAAVSGVIVLLGLIREVVRHQRRRNPTAGWHAAHSVALELDLDRHALSGVPVGSALARLDWLGPAMVVDEQELGWPARGLVVGLVPGTGREPVVSWYLLVWSDPLYPTYRPFAGVCRHCGAEVPLSEKTTEAELVARFGAPVTREPDDRETILYYEWDDGRVAWEIELTKGGRLKAWNILVG